MAQRGSGSLAAPVSPCNPNYTAGMGRDRFDHCKAKSLIYGGDERVDTPVKSGMKIYEGRPGANTRGEAPFATYDGASEAKFPPTDAYQLKSKNKQVQEKVGDKGFDPKVYAVNRHSNYVNQQESKRRNFVGSGNILAFQANGEEVHNEEEEHLQHHQGY